MSVKINDQYIATNGANGLKNGSIIECGNADLTDITNYESAAHRISIIGDNFTEITIHQYNFPYWLKQKNPNLSIENISTIGSQITSEKTEVPSIYTESLSISSNPNYIILYGGFNDWNDDVVIGSYTTDYSDIATNPTFYKGIYRLISTVRESFPTIPIMFCTPLYAKDNYTDDNANGDTIYDFVAAIKDVCGKFAVPVIDLNSCANITQKLPNSKAAYFIDDMYPNSDGSEIISSVVEEKLRDITRAYGGSW